MTINQQSFLVSNMCDEFMVCGGMRVWSDNILIRGVCGEESSVMSIEGVPPTAIWDCFCCEAIEREEKLTIPASRIDIYLQQQASSSVLPIRCKWGWTLPPKSYCVFLALCVVRTLLFASFILSFADCWLPSREFVSLVVQDGRWEKEDADAEINRGISMSTTYWYYIVLCHILSFDIWF